MNLKDKKEYYLLKLNIKSNNDLFFLNFEEFETYQITLKKKIIKDIILINNIKPQEIILYKIFEFLDNKDENLSIFNITTEEFFSFKNLSKKKFDTILSKKFEITLDEKENYAKYNSLIQTNQDIKSFVIYEISTNFLENVDVNSSLIHKRS